MLQCCTLEFSQLSFVWLDWKTWFRQVLPPTILLNHLNANEAAASEGTQVVQQQSVIFVVSRVYSDGVQPNGSCCKKGLKISCTCISGRKKLDGKRYHSSCGNGVPSLRLILYVQLRRQTRFYHEFWREMHQGHEAQQKLNSPTWFS